MELEGGEIPPPEPLFLTTQITMNYCIGKLVMIIDYILNLLSYYPTNYVPLNYQIRIEQKNY